MSGVEINLLPQAYRLARRHERWFQRGVAVGLALVAAELAVGLTLYIQAGQKRELIGSIKQLNDSHGRLGQELSEVRQKAAQVNRNLALARELRASHRWSRLLGAMAGVVPEDVVLSSITTEPAKWSPGTVQTAPALPTISPQKAVAGQQEAQKPPPPLLNGINIRGYAVDHQGLAKLMNVLHSSGVFAGIDLQRMQRDKLAGQDAVTFEIRGHW